MTPNDVERTRLSTMLDRREIPLTVLHAPSGYGKTTLVRQWVAALSDDEITVVWVALNAEITDRDLFWATVLSSASRLGHVAPGRADEVQQHVAAVEDPVPVLAELLEGGGEVVVVLDAYEHVREAATEVDEDLLRLADSIEGLRIIITTRAATSLADPSLRLRTRVQVLTERDLAFTLDETVEFLRGHGADRPEDGRVLHRDTRGYPLAIRAAQIATGATPLAAQASAVEWRSIVARDLQTQLAGTPAFDFVRDSCVAPYFDLELATALTGVHDVPALVRELEWNGLGRWVPYQADRPVFQYVDALRDIVRADLSELEPERYRRAAGIAAGWLHEHGEHELALELAVDGGRYELASKIFRSVLLSSPESYTTDRLDRQLSRVPRSALVKHPTLAFARGLALLSNPATRGAAGEFLLRTAEQTPADWRDLDRPSSFFQRVAKSACLRYIGRYREAAEAARSAIEFYDDIDIGDEGELVELRAMALRQLAYSFFQAGQVDLSLELATRAIGTATMPWSRNYTLVYGVGLAAIDGRSRTAENVARLVDPDAWPRDHAFTFVNALGRVGQSVLRLDAFDFEGALAEYEGCESFLHTAEFWPFITWSLLHARLGTGDMVAETNRIAEALDASPKPPGTGENFGTAALHGLLAIAWMAQGRGAEATALLRVPSSWPGQLAPAQVLSHLVAGDALRAFHLVPGLEELAGHSVRSRAALSTIGAAAALRAGHQDAAVSLVERAAALHAEHGVRAHLLYVPAEDLENLRSLAGSANSSAAEAYLDVSVPGRVKTLALSTPLTAQEIAVLRASMTHAQRRDVAAALHVSPETVKSHMRSIYRKWNVSTRADAIERGLQLGVFHERERRNQP